MDATPAFTRARPDVLGWSARLMTAGLIAVAAFLAGLVFLLLASRLAYGGRALPGVHIGTHDVSGLSAPEIEIALGQTLTYPQSGRILLRDGSSVWTATPADLGAVLDAPTMAAQALAVGRTGNLFAGAGEQLDAWFGGAVLPPVLILDERVTTAYLATLATQLNRATIEAGFVINGRQVEVQPGQIGRQLDVLAGIAAIASSVGSMTDAVIDLPVVETPPAIMDASAQAAVARELLAAPFSLTADGAGPWVFEPEEVAELIRFARVEDGGAAELVVGLDEAVMIPLLANLAPEVDREPENARFIFNDDTRQLELLRSAVIGRALDVPATLDAIQLAVSQAQHGVPLVFRTEAPAVGDDATAEELGITENLLLASYGSQGASTYFGGSSPERVQNITTAAAQFHGVLVAPGATFSMGDYLGDVSLDTGYAEALIIFGNRTIKGVGGGVCQVSTTLFRAVFFAGYPIVERYPHAYRVGYYEQGPNSPGPGMDATVFLPLVDFKFTNDTPYWLLMETYIYGNQLLWKFYSTSDGRTVEWSSERANEVKAPKTLYRENEDLPEGKIEQVDWSAKGLDVVVYRTVRRAGEILYQDEIKTHYLPWRAIFEYGPGTELPEDANTDED
jgi:vancomycin resistance protein YoaR